MEKKVGRDFLAPVGDANSFVAWYVDLHNYGVDATLTLADCNRRIELMFSEPRDLAKLDVIRHHLDEFEKQVRKAFKAHREQEKAKAEKDATTKTA